MAQFTLAQIFGPNYEPKYRAKKLKKPKLNKEVLCRLVDHADAHNRVVAKQRNATISRTLHKLEKDGDVCTVDMHVLRRNAKLRTLAAARKLQMRSQTFLPEGGCGPDLSLHFDLQEMQMLRDEMRAIRSMSPAELALMKDKLLRELKPNSRREKSEDVVIVDDSLNKEQRKKRKYSRHKKRSSKAEPKVDLDELQNELASLKALRKKLKAENKLSSKRIVILSSDDDCEVLESMNICPEQKDTNKDVVEVLTSSDEEESEPRSIQGDQTEDHDERGVLGRWKMTS